MKLVNLTPHKINILLGAGISLEIPPEGNPARLSVRSEERDPIEDGRLTIPVSTHEVTGIEGLPEPADDTVYIVPLVVAQYAKREDVMSPARLMRDENGQPIGCMGLLAHA